MLQAIVVGNVWSTKRIDGLPSGAFLEVEVTGSGERLVAFDVLGSGRGERVLIAQGSVAAGWLPDRPPVDALIIGSIDEPTAGPEPATAGAASTGAASTGSASTGSASTGSASTGSAGQGPARNKARKGSPGGRSSEEPGSPGASR